MRVLLLAPHFAPGYRAGGALRSLVTIVRTADESLDILVLTRPYDHDKRARFPSSLAGKRVRFGKSSVWYLTISNLPALLKEIRTERHLLYINSLWDPFFALLPAVLWRVGILRARTMLVAPRGELSPGALAISPRKKWVARKLWHWIIGSRRVVFHASSDIEASHCRQHFPRERVVTSLDPVDLPARAEIDAFEAPSSCLQLVFIGRVSPKKNLHTTLKALAQVSSPIRFRIIGPRDEDYWQKCQELIDAMPENIDVEVLPAIPHDRVRAEFASSHLFVFPTHGENFGHVVAESLSVGCAVICGPDTPWTPVMEDGGGWIVDPNDAAALGRMLDALAAEGENEWHRYRSSAALAYDRWMAGRDDSHILSLLKNGD